MTQILPSDRPTLRRGLAAHTAVAARLLAHAPPRRIRALLLAARRGAAPATYQQALADRSDVVAISGLCSGKFCRQRALATALLCRMRRVWPTWSTGVRPPRSPPMPG